MACSNLLLWRHNGYDCVPNHQPHHCLFNCLFERRSKKTSKLRVTGLCVGNTPVPGDFPAQMASNAQMFPFDDVIMGTWSDRHLSSKSNINFYEMCNYEFMNCSWAKSHSNAKMLSYSIKISVIKIRRSYDRLILTTEIAIPGKAVFVLKHSPRFSRLATLWVIALFKSVWNCK